MKVYDSYAAVIAAIDTYNDTVLQEARDLVLALCAHKDANWDSLLDELNGTFEDDCRAIGEWDEAEELCTDELRLERVLARGRMHAALGMLDAQQPGDAIVELMFAMLTRSIAHERLYG